MVGIFIAVKNKYLNFSAVTKLATTQNNLKRVEARSHVSQLLNLNSSGTKRDVDPKQRYDRFLSVGDHIRAILTFEHVRGTPRHTLIEGS